MDNQPFDHIEDRIRQAAENVSPPLNEKGWEKMEALLNKEFEKDRRRRLALWWPVLLLLMLGGAAIYYFSSQDRIGGNKQGTGEKSQGEATKTLHREKVAVNGLSNEERLKTSVKKSNQKFVENGSANTSVQPHKNPTGNSGENLTSNAVRDKVNQHERTEKDHANKLDRQGSETDIDGAGVPHSTKNRNKAVGTKTGVKDDLAITNSTDTHEPLNSGSDQTAASTPVTKDSDLPASKSNGQPDSIVTIKTTAKNSLKNKETRPPARMYFIASVAADAASINKFNLDNVSTVFGAGAGYHFNKRLSIQTGFYAGKKIYQAGPGDYNTKAGTYLDTVNILKVNAECLVFDIPVSLRYDIIQKKNFNIYSVAGLSSFIMKKEIYDYHYTYRYNGAYHQYDWTYTGNKHFFSVADLSVGFEYKLSNSFYIQGEPYVKIPLAGVGEGKVKLYSAGIQFGIKYQPLKKKKK